jgi:hypothetical protein
MSGPFETEREARELPAVQDIYAAFRADPGVGRMAPHAHKMLIGACEAAGVELGAFDRRILLWLSGWEPQTCAVIAGLISRAHDAGCARVADAGAVTLTAEQLATVLGALADAQGYRMREADAFCGDCDTSPAGACWRHLNDLDAAQEYHALAARLPKGGHKPR